MITALIRHELRLLTRNGIFISLACAMLALMLGAAALSSQRIAAFDRERSAAEAIDKQVWESQGERNPHSAAHFARYAFKPVSNLVAFDPGVTDYAGLALWMEAHYQNPAIFRRAEDLGDAGRFADLSPAWILQYIAPLFLFLILFSTIAGEREQGTLRQVTAGGMKPLNFLFGKLLGAGVGAAIIIVPALLLSLLVAAFGGNSALPDSLVRIVGLFLVYGLYFVAIGGIALGISALCRQGRTALIVLVTVWGVSFVLLPRLGAAVAMSLFPTPEASFLAKELSSASRIYRADPANKEQLEKTLLAEYGVEKVNDLPILFNAYELQYSEELAHPEFEAFYQRLEDIAVRQDGVIRTLSVFSPVLALDSLSSGLAGTDRLHHRAFTKAAEDQRRKSVKHLNEDFMVNGGRVGYDYTAGEELWREIGDFSYTPPGFGQVATSQAMNFLILLLYAVGGLLFAQVAVRRMQKGIAA